MKEAQSALVKMERTKLEMNDKLSDYEIDTQKQKRIHDDYKEVISRLEDRLSRAEEEKKASETQKAEIDFQKRSLQSDLDMAHTKKLDLESTMDKMENVKRGLKKKLEQAYFDLEETRREIGTITQDHEEVISTLEAEVDRLSCDTGMEDEVKMLRSKNAALERTVESKEEEVNETKERVNRIRKDRTSELEEAKEKTADSYKVKMRLQEEKHAEETHRFNEALEQHKQQVTTSKGDLLQLQRTLEQATTTNTHESDELEKLRMKQRQMEDSVNEYKELLDQKQMMEVKRRGEFAKQRQELEILRSKERHLETHVGQLEEHISKVVSDYETRLQNSGSSVVSHTEQNETNKLMLKKMRDMEKKLEVSNAAMKQLGKSSLLMEKENERLKHDKNELKMKLKKLVDCAEMKFSSPQSRQSRS